MQWLLVVCVYKRSYNSFTYHKRIESSRCTFSVIALQLYHTMVFQKSIMLRWQHVKIYCVHILHRVERFFFSFFFLSVHLYTHTQYNVHNSCYFNRHTSGPLLVRLKSFMESEDIFFLLSSTLFGHYFFFVYDVITLCIYICYTYLYTVLHVFSVCFSYAQGSFLTFDKIRKKNHSFFKCVFIRYLHTEGSYNRFLQILIFFCSLFFCCR